MPRRSLSVLAAGWIGCCSWFPAHSGAIPIPGTIPSSEIVLTLGTNQYYLGFQIQVDHPGWFDLHGRFPSWQSLQLKVDDLPVRSDTWFGPDEQFSGTVYDPNALNGVRAVDLTDVNCFPGVMLTPGLHRVQIVSGGQRVASSSGTNSSVTNVSLAFSRVPGRLRTDPPNPGNLPKAILGRVTGLGSDASGNIYVTEPSLGRIRKRNPKGIITTVFQVAPGPEITFRDFSVDGAGNCYFRGPGMTDLFQVGTDGVLQTLQLSRGAPLASCTASPSGPVPQTCVPENELGNEILTPQVSWEGRIRYVLRFQREGILTVNHFPTRVRTIDTQIVERNGSGNPNVLERYTLHPELEDLFRRVAYRGSQIVGLHPSRVSSPLAEIAADQRLDFQSINATHLLGATVSIPGMDHSVAVGLDPDTCYLARDQKIWLIHRHFARPLFSGSVNALTVLPDGTVVGLSAGPVDGTTELLYLHPEDSWSPAAPQYSLDVSVRDPDYHPASTAFSGSPTYSSGETVQVRAVSGSSRQIFMRWSGDVTSTNNPLELVMNGNKRLVAEFGYRLDPSRVPFADVSLDPDQPGYETTTLVTVTIRPRAKNYVVSWSDGSTNLVRTLSGRDMLTRFPSLDFRTYTELRSELSPTGGDVLLEYRHGDGTYSLAPFTGSRRLGPDQNPHWADRSFRFPSGLAMWARAQAYPGWRFKRWIDGTNGIRRVLDPKLIPHAEFGPDPSALGAVTLRPSQSSTNQSIRLEVHGPKEVPYVTQQSNLSGPWQDLIGLRFDGEVLELPWKEAGGFFRLVPYPDQLLPGE